VYSVFRKWIWSVLVFGRPDWAWSGEIQSLNFLGLPDLVLDRSTPLAPNVPANRNVEGFQVSRVLAFPVRFALPQHGRQVGPIPDCWIWLQPSEHSLRLPSAFVDRTVASGGYTASPTDGTTLYCLAGDGRVRQWTENATMLSRTVGSPERILLDIVAAFSPAR
jgi:hypothetical protein